MWRLATKLTLRGSSGLTRRVVPTSSSSWGASSVAACWKSTVAVVDEEEEEEHPAFAKESISETGEWAGCTRQFQAPLRISVRGSEILTHPLFNKETAFKSGERDRLRFRGLLPHRIMNIQLQKERFMTAMRLEDSNIRKNILLEDLHDRNETLYHRVIVDHIEEVAPLIYTPTVGQACQEFAARYRRPRGMYFTEEDRGHMAAMVYNWPHKVRWLGAVAGGK